MDKNKTKVIKNEKKVQSKNKKKRDKRKKRKLQNENNLNEKTNNNNSTINNEQQKTVKIKEEEEKMEDIVVEYIMPTNPLEILEENKNNIQNFESYQKIFEKFYSNKNGETEIENNTNTEIKEEGGENENRKETKKKEEKKEDEEKRLTKKERKEQKRLKVSILKQLTDKPSIVESHDVTSSDPLLLVHLKCYRNTVSVPRHWLRKRKYLQGKRGSEKKPFKLPKYITDTGVIDLREAAREKDQQKTTKQKARERVQPKMMKGEIDYQSLHDAFFVHQTKPTLTGHGDLYYEGKEFDVVARSKNYRPGFLSNKLREALGMPKLKTETSDPLSSFTSYEQYFCKENEPQLAVPPPWLLSMQRWGPPPSYPKLKIAGVSSPLPPGAKWGFNPGQWGKPPVDNFGHPLWGDLFGNLPPPIIHHFVEDIPEEQKKWRFGVLSSEKYFNEEMEEEENLNEEEEQDKETQQDNLSSSTKKDEKNVDFVNQIPEKEESKDEIMIGIEHSSLIPSEKLDLRKDQQESKQLYTLLEKQSVSVGEKGIYGSSHKYIFNTINTNTNQSNQDKVPIIKNLQTEKQIITIDPNELESLENKSSGAKFLLEKFNEKNEESKGDHKKHGKKPKDYDIKF